MGLRKVVVKNAFFFLCTARTGGSNSCERAGGKVQVKVPFRGVFSVSLGRYELRPQYSVLCSEETSRPLLSGRAPGVGTAGAPCQWVTLLLSCRASHQIYLCVSLKTHLTQDVQIP